MTNSLKIVFKRGDCGGFYPPEGSLLADNEKAIAFLKYANLGNYDLVKVCRGKEISELYRDKHNNYIYREYEKN